MLAAEIRDGGALLGTALGEIAELARDVHKALARRVFGRLGASATPVRLLHDAISATAYGGSRLGVQVLPTLAGAMLAERAAPYAQSCYDSPRGHVAMSALSGVWGDRLAEHRPALAPVLAVRTHGGRLRHVPANVVHDLKDATTGNDTATSKIVLFVHGLGESERTWWSGAHRTWRDPRATYGSQLREERGWTPLYLHYNTGLHISDSGQLVADYLQDLVAEWPVPVTEIALVGHSMGGLVARSAAHQAHARQLTWVGALRHIVGLGTPHLGAPLEQWVNAGTHAMARVPETLPIAAWLNRRSAGIKDLRWGALLEDDWADGDPDDRVDRCAPAPLLPGVAYSMVSATLSRRPDGPFAHDLLVEHVSAHGTGRPDAARRIEFEVDRLFHIGGRSHFQLSNDVAVYDQLRSWLNGTAPSARADPQPQGSVIDTPSYRSCVVENPSDHASGGAARDRGVPGRALSSAAAGRST